MKLHKRLAGLGLALALCLSTALPALAQEPAETISGTAFYRSTLTTVENTVSYIYREEWFRGDPAQADPGLASLSMTLAASATYGETAVALLEDLGFQAKALHFKDFTEENTAYTVGSKQLADGTPLVVIVPQADGYYGAGWAQNFRVGETGDHAGYAQAVQAILEEITVPDGAVIWVVGYSRGAGIANVLAARLTELGKGKVFAYTFAAPNTTDAPEAAGEEYENIHNYRDPRDPVALVPPAAWGFVPYGTVEELGTDEEELLPMLERLNASAAAGYRRHPAEKTVAGLTVEDFLGEALEALVGIIPSREDYVTPRQGADGQELPSYEKTLTGVLRTGMDTGLAETLHQLQALEEMAALGMLENADQLKADALESLKQMLEKLLPLPEAEDPEEARLAEDQRAAILLQGLSFGQSLIAAHHNDVMLAQLLCRDEDARNGAYRDRSGESLATRAGSLRDGAYDLTPEETVYAAASPEEAAEIVITAEAAPCRVRLPVENLGPTVVVYAGEEAAPVKTTLEAGAVTFLVTEPQTVVRVADNCQPLMDVKGNRWYLEGVHWAASHGVMVGVAPWIFQPETKMTRAMMAQVLATLEGADLSAGENDFTDVKERAWYAPAVRWAAAEGLMIGYPDGSFRPEEPITREQMVTVLYRYLGSPAASGDALAGFRDRGKLSSYAEDAMQYAVSTGLVNGTSATVLAPQGTATRAQMATILMRLFTE